MDWLARLQEGMPVVAADGPAGSIAFVALGAGAPGEPLVARVMVRPSGGGERGDAAAFPLTAEMIDRVEGGVVYLTGAKGAAADPGGRPGPGDDVERLRIPVLEERLDVRARPVEIGRARVRKDVEERVERHPVRLRRQEVRVERVPIDREVAGVVEPFMDGDVYVVPVLEEQVVIQRRLVVREEIRVRRVLSEREETLEVPLRGERVTVEEDLPLEGAAGGEAGSEPT